MKSPLAYCLQDWRANPHDLRIRGALFLFRAAQIAGRQPRWLRVLLFPGLAMYRVLLYGIMHMELHWTLSAGPRLRIFHGYCLVIHPQTRLGAGVTLRHCTTLGNKGDGGLPPVIEDNADIGAHAVVLGPVRIGAGARIGAGSVVTKDVPPGATVAGNPARELRPADPQAPRETARNP